MSLRAAEEEIKDKNFCLENKEMLKKRRRRRRKTTGYR
jgi:hypothetical protein